MSVNDAVPDVSKVSAGQVLFTLSLSPVQKFIGAARRMRDLAYGSQLLTQLADSLASHLAGQHKAILVFPAPGSQHGTHKIVCLLPVSTDAAKVAADLRAALQTKLQEEGQRCRSQLDKSGFLPAIDDVAFATQIAQSLRLFQAWSTLASGDAQGYAQAYRAAQRLLDARKGLRDFAPLFTRPGWQLSSLDGEHDSVLTDGHQPGVAGSDAAALAPSRDALRAASRLRRRYQIDAGEQLDAAGLVKRTLGTEQGFPAVVRVALQPWVAQWQEAESSSSAPAGAKQRLNQLEDCLSTLVTLDRARRNRVQSGPLKVLPFDGDLLLASRRLEERKRLEREKDPSQGAIESEVAKCLECLDRLLADEPGLSGASGQKGGLRSEEGLYVAVLVADGDHMGSGIIDPAAGIEPPAVLHQKLAQVLDQLARDATLNVQCHGGHALYAGGDDLLAVLPVQSALACAESLRLAFAKGMGGVLPANLQRRATLSIGLAIGHVSEPMGRLLARAHAACDAAKAGPEGHGLRNALGLVVQPRSGASVSLQRHWDDDVLSTGPAAPSPLVERLIRWRDAFADGTLAGSLPYDLRRAIEDEPKVALRAACRRLLERRGVTDDRLRADIDAHWAYWIDGQKRSVAWATDRLADELYLCRWLASHPRPVAIETDAAPAVASVAESIQPD